MSASWRAKHAKFRSVPIWSVPVSRWMCMRQTQYSAIALQQSCNRAATERWLSTRRTVAFTSLNIWIYCKFLSHNHISVRICSMTMCSLYYVQGEKVVLPVQCITLQVVLKVPCITLILILEGRKGFFSSQSARWLCQRFSKEQYLIWWVQYRD